MQKHIRAETRNAKAGKPARIIVQTNSLVDQETIDNLYRASQAGVKIDLIVRGICNLVPNIKGVSDNIRVRSILGRYLEHSRIFYFENSSGNQPHIFAGSADWMPRNFYRRIEAIFPIEDPDHRARILDLLETYLKDTRNARILRSNGSYHKPSRKNDAQLFSAQEAFFKHFEAKRTAQAQELTEDPKIMPVTEVIEPA